MGSVLGLLSAQVDSSGTSGTIALDGGVLDAGNTTFITTSDKAVWYSETANWLSMGTLKADSVFSYPAYAMWNVTSLFNYANHAYNIHATDFSGDGDKLFDLYALGGYGGADPLHWYVSYYFIFCLIHDLY